MRSDCALRFWLQTLLSILDPALYGSIRESVPARLYALITPGAMQPELLY